MLARLREGPDALPEPTDRHVETQDDEGAVTSVKGSHNDMGRQVMASPIAGTVLLVDDMLEDALLLAVLLAPLGARILVARSAEEALAMLDTEVVDLVVTDLNMPGASGLDLARELRRRLDAPAVIFMTGSQLAKDKETAFELGAVAYLQKPVDVSHLLGLTREILRSRGAERAGDAAVETAPMTSRAR
jgi:CheY-like chemotaxis protein